MIYQFGDFKFILVTFIIIFNHQHSCIDALIVNPSCLDFRSKGTFAAAGAPLHLMPERERWEMGQDGESARDFVINMLIPSVAEPHFLVSRFKLRKLELLASRRDPPTPVGHFV